MILKLKNNIMKTTKLILGLLMSTIIFGFVFIPDSGLEIGDVAMDFKLKNVDGNMIALSDYKNEKGVILVFTCNTCPYSEMYEQRIIDLDNKYKASGFPVVAINPNDPIKQPGDAYEEMVKLARDKKYPFPYLVDETQNITTSYGATNTPHVYVLQYKANGFIVKYIGAIDNNTKDGALATQHYVASAVDALIANKDVEVTSTKAIGCTIKWKD